MLRAGGGGWVEVELPGTSTCVLSRSCCFFPFRSSRKAQKMVAAQRAHSIAQTTKPTANDGTSKSKLVRSAASSSALSLSCSGAVGLGGCGGGTGEGR